MSQLIKAFAQPLTSLMVLALGAMACSAGTDFDDAAEEETLVATTAQQLGNSGNSHFRLGVFHPLGTKTTMLHASPLGAPTPDGESGAVKDGHPPMETRGLSVSIGLPGNGAFIPQRPRPTFSVITFRLDSNENDVLESCTTDRCYKDFGAFGDTAVVGDWVGDGTSKVGTFRDGVWHLDTNGNGVWDGCTVDRCANFGQAGDKPVVMSRYGQDAIGVFRDGSWHVDKNGDFDWDGCSVDSCYQFGQAGDIPVTRCGNSLGVFRNGQWIVDQGGNNKYDGCSTDDCFTFGQAGDVPLTAGCTIGYYRNGTAYFDMNGDRKITDCGTDGCYNLGGLTGQQPIVGVWDCGGPNQKCCETPGSLQKHCEGGLECYAKGCQEPVCPPGEKCCVQSCGAGETCIATLAGGGCFNCGGAGEACCGNGTCDSGLACGASNSTILAGDGGTSPACGNQYNVCGGEGKTCCGNSVCAGSLTCQGNVCKKPAAPSCGTFDGAACCSGSKCSDPWLECDTSTNRCRSCGATSLGCCGNYDYCDVESTCVNGTTCTECGGYGQPCCGTACDSNSLQCNGGYCW